MNHSIYTADKATHLKVVIAALFVSIAIMATMLGAKLVQRGNGAQAKATQTVYKMRPSSILTEVTRIEKRPI